jgi:hypothetical protein
LTESGPPLKAALVMARRALKERGFSAKGTTFYRKCQTGNTVVLSVQKSVKSSSADAQVTINYGVYSQRIGGRLQDDASSALDVSKAHWRKRLSEGGREKWLRVKSEDSPEVIGRIILGAAEDVLTELAQTASDEALRGVWLSGSSPGIGNMQRLLFLAILINEIGPADRLKGVVADLRSLVSGSAHERLVEGRLARAGVQSQ